MLVIPQRSLSLFLAAFVSFQLISCGSAEKIIGIDQISQTNLLSRLETKEPLLILEVRTSNEYAEGHIPGAINIDFKQLQKRVGEIKKFQNSTIVVYCETGIRAKVAEVTLLQAGFTSILHLEGHMSAWRKKSLPLAKSPSAL